MVYRKHGAGRRFVASIVLALPLAAGIILPGPSPALRPVQPAGRSASFHDDQEQRKQRLSRAERSLEARIWHAVNQQQAEEAAATGAEAAAPDVIQQDMNDIAVMQGDNKLVTLPRLFDLNGRSVTFMPSAGGLAAAGYTISTASALFDANVGTKRNLAAAPAVNPSPVSEPGDDAYIVEDIGFNFTFFGVNYSSVAISSNGNLVFRPGNVSQGAFDAGAIRSIASLGEFQGGLPRIAGYWHDLDARASVTSSSTTGIFVRKASDRIIISWNNVRDFPNDPSVDNGTHRFQITLASSGRITITYDAAQLTSQALVGITPGGTQTLPVLTDLSAPPSSVINAPVGEFFSTALRVDYIAATKAFYATHRDVYDFIYFMTDFDFDLGGGFAFYDPLRNDATGIGLPVENPDTTSLYGSRKLEGVLNLSNLAGLYPPLPTTRFLGANHALSIMGQEQGHRWLSFVRYPGNDTLLLGRDDAHWSFFMNIESSTSSPAARRSSSAEGNVWRDNGNGTFTSVNLIDGFSRLDHYLMGLRPASDVPDTFVITNPSGSGRSRESNPAPNVTTNGSRQAVTINQIIQANNSRSPNSTAARKSFRAAVILLVRQGTQPTAATLDKVTLYRLAWESYFAQSTDSLGHINTGLADSALSREIAPASAASYALTLAPGAIASLFGSGMANATLAATTQPLPTTLANVQVRVNGVVAPLFFVSPSQINFQVPRGTQATTPGLGVSSATATIEVLNNGQLIRAGAFQIAPAVPASFTLNASGSGPVAAVDAIRGGGTPFNAKQPNGQPTILAVFGSGLGADATDVDGNVNASVQATIDGTAVPVGYAGRAPGFTGLNQINITFPANINSGTHTLVISRSGIAGQPVTFVVQ
jgi:uncharacterized protein (TIGR03437 family)